ncbi:MAG: hypothetical protein DRI89_10640 [Bacteroidetes bacterium]|nr:MAG: hypothetical protein DRI89_10640 [Bacteroidota bacterium]
MKRIFLSAILLFSAILLTAATIEKTYYFSNPAFSKKGEYQRLSFTNTMLTSLPGQPVLPYHAISLLLPPGESAVSLEFIGEEEIVLEGNYQLYPYQPSRPLSDEPKRVFVKDESVYQSDELYPENQTGILSSEFMNGHGFAFSSFTPVHYHPQSGKISYYSKVTVRIKTVSTNNASTALKNLNTNPAILSKVKNLAQNPSAIKQYSQSKNRDADDYRLLIITPDQFKDEFDDLTDIYLERGVPSEVFTTEYIGNNISGQDLQEKIRNFIIQEYQDHAIEFVLLGGDVEHIPYRGFYCYVQSGGGYETSDIPADLYYSGLDGTWNDNGDSKWGEPGEDDLLPDVAVARFPFSTSSELTKLIHKSITYQNSPILGELTNPLLAGEHLYSAPETWGRDYLDLLIGERSDNGYTTIGIPNDYPIDSLYEHEQSWGGSDLMNAINQGKQFVHHVGHASPSTVAHLSTNEITNTNFSGANGVDHNFTLFHTHGCDCGAFDYNDCILERMVLIDNFAVAVIGNSRYGWFNEGQTEGPAAHLHREMVDALYHEKINHLAKAMAESKIQTAPWVTAPGQHEEGALRWNFYDLNILGDPALSVWTAEPIAIDVVYNNTLPIGTTTLSVTINSDGQAMENFTCTVMKDGVLHGYGITDATGETEIIFDPLVTEVGEAELVISGYNCLPDTNSLLFIPADGPYVVYAEHEIQDPDGNNNGLVDYGEFIFLDLSVRNVGSDPANNAQVTLISGDNNLVVLDDNENYGNIPAGDTVMVAEGFSLNVATNAPDQHVVTLQLVVVADEDIWNSDFEIMLQAPLLTLGNFVIDDSDGGDGNGRLDPGETANLLIDASNFGHSNCFDAMVNLETNSTWLTIEQSLFDLGDLTIDETKVAAFSVTVDDFAPEGSPAELTFELVSGDYYCQENIAATIGLLMEDFETGDFTAFEWRSSGQAGWTVTDEWPFEGSYCSKSGYISDLQYTDLFITLTTLGEGELSFCRKVSSEQDWDYLWFYIDDISQGAWSGEKDWEQFSYPLSSGTHTLKWSYVKDQNTSGGSDCAWLDNIVFPTTTTIISVEETSSDAPFTLFPNPSNGKFNLQLLSIQPDNVQVKVYNTMGKIVYEKIITAKNSTLISIDLGDANSGLYLVEISAGNAQWLKKVLVR